jgi:crooked neck
MKVPRIKNYAPAEIQVTSEQLIRESIQYQLDEHRPTQVRITDPEELEDYKYRMRKSYEDSLRM